MRVKREIDIEAFTADCQAGMSVNALRKKYGIAYDRAQFLASSITKQEVGRDEPEPAEEDEQENLSISLEFPRSRTLEFLSAFPPDEIIAVLADFDEPS